MNKTPRATQAPGAYFNCAGVPWWGNRAGVVFVHKGEKMKDKIHPNYKEATIVCACGETVHTRSTKPSIRVEICSKCHPFFTGKQKFVDSAGRVDKFIKKYAKK